MRDADKIVVLSEEGTIAEQGDFDSLDLKRGYLQSLIVDYQAEGSHSCGGSDIYEGTRNGPATAPVKSSEPDDDLLRKTGDMTLYRYYFESVGWKDGVTILVLTICGQFCVYFPR